MITFKSEQKLFSKNYKLIGAVDEAGRGPLAGPVVAACILIPCSFKITGDWRKVNDSKKLSPKNREHLFKIITKNFEYGIGICDHKTIDKLNIHHASLLAMKRAIKSLNKKPDILLIDGKFSVRRIGIKQKTVIHGDATLFSIAAASILAKVTRDKIMKKMHELYPGYNFNQHKGYCTKSHVEKIKELGRCPIHRKSFSF